MIKLSAYAGALSKLISAACSFASVPLILQSVGPTMFGTWATYQSFQMILPFADFGIGNGMMNAVTQAASSKDERRIQTLITTGLAMLVAIAVLCGVGATLAWPQLIALLGSSAGGGDQKDLCNGFLVFLTVGILAIPLSCAERTAAALQTGYVPHLVRAISAVVSLVLVIAVSRSSGSFVAFCAATVVPTLIGPPITWWWLSIHRPSVVPRPQAFEAKAGFAMARTGVAFFIVQLTAVFGFGLDTVLVERYSGATDAGNFAIVQRFYSLIPVVAGIALTPLWPACADARARGDYEWIHRTFRNSLMWSIGGGSVMSVVLAWVAQWAIPFWIGQSAQPALRLVLIYAVWSAVFVAGMALSYCWNGMHWLRLQATLGVIFTLVSWVSKKTLISLWGSEAVVMTNIAAYLAIVIIPGCVLSFLRLRNAIAETSPSCAALSNE